jgi:hypothetical protein
MQPSYEIRFNSLYRGHGLCFPCDEKGQVELDALSDRAARTTSTPAPSSASSSRTRPSAAPPPAAGH